MLRFFANYNTEEYVFISPSYITVVSREDDNNFSVCADSRFKFEVAEFLFEVVMDPDFEVEKMTVAALDKLVSLLKRLQLDSSEIVEMLREIDVVRRP